MLPEGVTLYNITNRSVDGYYMIGPGSTSVFAFIIPILGISTITVSSVPPPKTSEDLSLSFWISGQPLDAVLFTNDNSLNPFHLNKLSRVISIWDKDITPMPNHTYAAQSNIPLYCNIQNMQNATNSFKLVFS